MVPSVVFDESVFEDMDEDCIDTDTPLKESHRIVDSALQDLANRISDKKAATLLNQWLWVWIDELRWDNKDKNNEIIKHTKAINDQMDKEMELCQEVDSIQIELEEVLNEIDRVKAVTKAEM